MQFTASAELRDKLERLSALMRASVPDGDLAAVIEAAVTEKLDRLEARRFGRMKSPERGSRAREAKPVKPADTEAATPAEEEPVRPAEANATLVTAAARRSRHVPAKVRRTVYERDQGRCRYVDDQGRRCTARVYLELHHGIPYAVGGEHSPSNMSLLCEAHNRLMAEIDFGAEAVDSHLREAASVFAAPELGVERLERPTTPAPATP